MHFAHWCTQYKSGGIKLGTYFYDIILWTGYGYWRVNSDLRGRPGIDNCFMEQNYRQDMVWYVWRILCIISSMDENRGNSCNNHKSAIRNHKSASDMLKYKHTVYYGFIKSRLSKSRSQLGTRLSLNFCLTSKTKFYKLPAARFSQQLSIEYQKLD